MTELQFRSCLRISLFRQKPFQILLAEVTNACDMVSECSIRDTCGITSSIASFQKLFKHLALNLVRIMVSFLIIGVLDGEPSEACEDALLIFEL